MRTFRCESPPRQVKTHPPRLAMPLLLAPAALYLHLIIFNTLRGKTREASDATEEDSSRTELLHYVTSKSCIYDGLAFRLAVSLVSTSGSFLRSFGSNLYYQLAHDTTNKKCQTNPHKVGARMSEKLPTSS